MSTIHHPWRAPKFDPDMNWKTRQEAEQARKALGDRHVRNSDVATVCVTVLGVIASAAVIATGLYEANRAGLFDWLKF